MTESFSSLVVWSPYPAVKPKVDGWYLVLGEPSDPQFRGYYHYSPEHGWNGTAHFLERTIQFWAKFPTL